MHVHRRGDRSYVPLDVQRRRNRDHQDGDPQLSEEGRELHRDARGLERDQFRVVQSDGELQSQEGLQIAGVVRHATAASLYSREAAESLTTHRRAAALMAA